MHPLQPSHRTSIKYTRYPRDVVPMFVAEMDWAVAEPVRRAVIERVEASDFGYIDGPGPLEGAFARFAAQRWGWIVPEGHLRIATDVSVGIVETLRLAVRPGEGVVVTTPVYPPFFELVEEAGCPVVEVPLVRSQAEWRLDLAGIESAFAAGARAMLLCNPHNPLGLVHDRADLERLAQLAAAHDVFVISDEVHAPLTHPGAVFTPFLPLAAAAGARSVCVTSASKSWNLAGAKCSVVVAGDPASRELVHRFPQEVASRVSILGLHANVAAFACTDWLDETIDRIVDNLSLLHTLVAERLPGVQASSPRAGYLAWLDLRALGLGDDPAARILEQARVALNSGPSFGPPGRGHARINLACEPEVLEEAVYRIARAFA